jgi:hypothetical protein
MGNMKIKAKLLMGFLIVALLTAAVGGVGIYSLKAASNETQLLNERAAMSILSVRLARNVDQQRAAYLGMAAFNRTGDAESAENCKSTLMTLESDFDSLVLDLEDRLIAAESRQILQDIKTSYSDFARMRDALVALLAHYEQSQRPAAGVRNGEIAGETAAGGAAFDQLTAGATFDQALIEAMKNVSSPAAALMTSSQTLTDFIDALTDDQAARAAQNTGNATILSVFILTLAVAIAVFLSQYISNIILRSLRQ